MEPPADPSQAPRGAAGSWSDEALACTRTLYALYDWDGALLQSNAAARAFYQGIAAKRGDRREEWCLKDVLETSVWDDTHAHSLDETYASILRLRSGGGGGGREGITVELRKKESGGGGAIPEERVHSARFVPTRETGLVGGAGILVIESDVSELFELRRVSRQLAEAQEQREAFFAATSHELKTPLTAIIALTELLQADPLPPTQTVQTHLKVICSNTRRLTLLCEDILAAATSWQPTLTITHTAVAIKSLLEEVIEASSPLVGNGVTVEAHIPEGLPLLQADGKRLAQVFTNLIGNACKSTQQGNISVRASVEEGVGIVVEVCDTGVGIPQDVLGGILDAFGGEQRWRGGGGGGLGLGIARSLVEAHGGCVEVRSSVDKADHGTTLRVALPLEPPTPQGGGNLSKDKAFPLGWSKDHEPNGHILEASAPVKAHKTQGGGEEGSRPSSREKDKCAALEREAKSARSGLKMLEIKYRALEGKLRKVQGPDKPPGASSAKGAAGMPLSKTQSLESVEGIREEGGTGVERKSSGSSDQFSQSQEFGVSHAFTNNSMVASTGGSDVSRSKNGSVASPPHSRKSAEAPAQAAPLCPLQYRRNSASPMPRQKSKREQLLATARHASMGRLECAIPTSSPRHGHQASKDCGAGTWSGTGDWGSLFSANATGDKGGQVNLPTHKEMHGRIEVMSVDDTPVNHMVLDKSLKNTGYKFTSCNDGVEALQLIQERGVLPDIMLLDIMMPHLSGYEVCARLRQLYGPGALPVILISAKAKDENIVEGFEAGANDYVVKPFRRAELLARISVQLATADLLHAAKQMALLGQSKDVLGCVGGPVLDDAPPGVAEIFKDLRVMECVTLVCIDFVSFEDVLGSCFDGDTALVVESLYREMALACQQYGMKVADSEGDLLVMLSGLDSSGPGAGVAVEEAASAMQAALRAIRCVSTVSGKARAFGVKAAVHTGKVFAYELHKGACMYLGEAVKTVRALCAHASPMSLTVSAATKAVLASGRVEAGQLDFADLGEMDGVRAYVLKHESHEWDVAINAAWQVDKMFISRLRSNESIKGGLGGMLHGHVLRERQAVLEVLGSKIGAGGRRVLAVRLLMEKARTRELEGRVKQLEGGGGGGGHRQHMHSAEQPVQYGGAGEPRHAPPLHPYSSHVNASPQRPASPSRGVGGGAWCDNCRTLQAQIFGYQEQLIEVQRSVIDLKRQHFAEVCSLNDSSTSRPPSATSPAPTFLPDRSYYSRPSPLRTPPGWVGTGGRVLTRSDTPPGGGVLARSDTPPRGGVPTRSDTPPTPPAQKGAMGGGGAVVVGGWSGVVDREALRELQAALVGFGPLARPPWLRESPGSAVAVCEFVREEDALVACQVLDGSERGGARLHFRLALPAPAPKHRLESAPPTSITHASGPSIVVPPGAAPSASAGASSPSSLVHPLPRSAGLLGLRRGWNDLFHWLLA